jgi:CBS domain-containing protein
MLLVRDIMQADVVTVTTDATARHLARLLADEEISGVPVLDGNGALAGVVSSTDLVRLAADEAGVEVRAGGIPLGVDPALDSEADDGESDAEQDPYGFFLPEDSPFAGQRVLEQWSESEFDAVLVKDIMTPVSFSVPPDTPLPELCEFLMKGRIHRAVVVEDGRLVGIVTSVDVLKAVAEGAVALA